ncbi:MAG: hypothetical protein J6B87_02835 [Clostridia bacterium]|nr:hypothetical protein [Clostridia bacterium]
MNDFLRNFVMNTIKKMIADNVDEWQVRQYALGWYEKMVLVKEDLETIETLYAEKEAQKELEAQVEIPSEEFIEKVENIAEEV